MSAVDQCSCQVLRKSRVWGTSEMNIGKFFGPSAIVVFTWCWVFGSITAASYFAFSLFPSMTQTVATIYFQTSNKEVVYWPNTTSYREQYASHLSDRSHLFVSGCETLPLSPMSDCDKSKNWYPLDLNKLGCTDVTSCTKTEYRIPKTFQIEIFATAKPIPDHKITLKDPNAVSFSDPATWGILGEWPVFFIALFLSVKLGRSAGEFLFTPYEKK
jgi:hypothetical protein